MQTESYIYKKEVDWSLLHLGINIPISLQDIFYQNIQLRLNMGENKKVKLLIDGTEYDAILTNINFDKNKYPKHKELLQIRYNPNSDISKKLRSIFFNSYNFLSVEKPKLINKKQQISVPIEKKEYVVIYATRVEDTFILECITTLEMYETKKAIQNIGEMELEQIINSTDSTSEMMEIKKIIKVRKLDRTIGDALKEIYSYKCQICNLLIGTDCGVKVIHTHHIEAFSKSLNNNPENIMVVCPNHHGIIHAANPVFDRRRLAFVYQNGYVESLKLNIHLR